MIAGSKKHAIVSFVETQVYTSIAYISGPAIKFLAHSARAEKTLSPFPSPSGCGQALPITGDRMISRGWLMFNAGSIAIGNIMNGSSHTISSLRHPLGD